RSTPGTEPRPANEDAWVATPGPRMRTRTAPLLGEPYAATSMVLPVPCRSSWRWACSRAEDTASANDGSSVRAYRPRWSGSPTPRWVHHHPPPATATTSTTSSSTADGRLERLARRGGAAGCATVVPNDEPVLLGVA